MFLLEMKFQLLGRPFKITSINNNIYSLDAIPIENCCLALHLLSVFVLKKKDLPCSVFSFKVLKKWSALYLYV